MRKGFSVFLFILFILAFPLALFYFNSQRTVLNPEFYQKTFSEVNLYHRLLSIDPRIITNYLAQQEGEEANPISGPQTEEYISHIMSMVSPEVVESTVNNNVEEVLNNVLMNGSQTMTVDLSLIKQAFSVQKLSAQDSEFINQIKEKYTIPVPPELKGVQRSLGRRNTMAPIYLGIALFLLLLSAILWPSWKGKLRIPGIIFLVIGLFTAGTAVVLKVMPLPNLGVIDIPELANISKDTFGSIKNQFLSLYLLEGEIMAGLGLVLTIVSAFLPGEQAKTPQVSIPQSPAQTQPAALLKKPEIPNIKANKSAEPKAKSSKT